MITLAINRGETEANVQVHLTNTVREVMEKFRLATGARVEDALVVKMDTDVVLDVESTVAFNGLRSGDELYLCGTECEEESWDRQFHVRCAHVGGSSIPWGCDELPLDRNQYGLPPCL